MLATLSRRSKERVYFVFFVVSAISSLWFAVQCAWYVAAYVHGCRLTARYRQEIADELRLNRLLRFATFACGEIGVDCTQVLKSPTAVATDDILAASRSYDDIDRMHQPYSAVLWSISNSTWAYRQIQLQAMLPAATIFVSAVLVVALVCVLGAWPTCRAYRRYQAFRAKRQARLDRFRSTSTLDDIVGTKPMEFGPAVVDMTTETTPMPTVSCEGVPAHVRYRQARPMFAERVY
jgi:hypothetical protein